MFSDPAKNVAQLGIVSGMRVADLGAGAGFYTVEAAKAAGNSGKVYAVDVQRELLEKVKRQAQDKKLFNVEIVWGNIENLGGTKLRDAAVDRVIISNVMFQVEHKDTALLEAKRVLKPGGKVLVVDWSSVSAMGPKQVISQMVMESLLEKAGLEREKSFTAGDHHYGLVYVKRQ